MSEQSVHKEQQTTKSAREMGEHVRRYEGGGVGEVSLDPVAGRANDDDAGGGAGGERWRLACTWTRSVMPPPFQLAMQLCSPASPTCCPGAKRVSGGLLCLLPLISLS